MQRKIDIENARRPSSATTSLPSRQGRGSARSLAPVPGGDRTVRHAVSPGDMLVHRRLVSDEECHVFDEEKRSYLTYVAGNVQGTASPCSTPSLSRASHSMAPYFGYVAGKNAVAGA
ncbi:MAG: hypothetical protein ACLSVD_03945 [Eggerthellaceae bacterium]